VAVLPRPIPKPTTTATKPETTPEAPAKPGQDDGSLADSAMGGVVAGSLADMRVRMEASTTIGVFGPLGTLTLDLAAPLAARRVLIQDLAADVAIDVTERVRIADTTVTISAEILHDAGASKNPSKLGAVVALR
jgi:hypothetical protein